MNQERVGKFIADLRKEHNLTQQELADKLSITDKAVSKWENGRCMPDVSFLEQLSSLFEVTVKELLNGEREFKKRNINYDKKILEIKNLSKSFGNRKALDDVNLDIYEGEIVGLIGPNGAGKTTLIKTMLNFYHYEKGSIKIEAYDVKRNLEEALSQVGAVIENPDMYGHLSGRKNLEITELINDIKDKEMINDFFHDNGEIKHYNK